MTFSTNEITSVTFCGSGVTEMYFNNNLVWSLSQPTPSVGGDVILTDDGGHTSSVTFSNGTVPNATFAQRQDIVSAEVGDGITTLGNGVFADCSGLTSVTIASSVTTLGDAVFNGDVTLSSITFNSTTPPTIGSGVFYDLPQSYVIYVPSSAVDTYKAAWSGSASHIQAIPTLGAYEIRAKLSDDTIVTATSTTATIGDINGDFQEETSYLGDYFPIEEQDIVEIEFGSSIYGFGEVAFLSCVSLEYIRIHSLSPDFRSGGEPSESYPNWGENTSGKLVFSMDLPVDYEVTYFDGALPENWVVCYEFERDVVITNSSQSNGEVALTYRDGIDGELETIIYLGEGETTTISAGTLWQGAASGEEYDISYGSGQKIRIESSPNFNYGNNYTFDSINVSGVTQESLNQSGFYPFYDMMQEIYMYGVSAMTFELQYTYEPCEPEEGCIDWDFENCICNQYEEPEPEPEEPIE